MRRKKLANKIVSILMAGMMVVSTPLSALAVDVSMSEDAVAAQEAAVEDATETNEAVNTENQSDEDAEEEEITTDELFLGGGTMRATQRKKR